jgi:hypothetical protein
MKRQMKGTGIVRLACGLSLFCTWPSAANAAEWAVISSRPNGVTVEVDRETFRLAVGGFTAWIRVTGPPAADGAVSYAYLATYHCGLRTRAIRYSVNFDANGRSLGGLDDPAPRDQPIVPGTTDDTIRSIVCRDYPRNEPALPPPT